MTEKEFVKQNWRAFDMITTGDNIKGKVLGVNFTTKSVRAFISGAPEWIRCELIDTHTTGKGENADDLALIEDLTSKVASQHTEIETLKVENQSMAKKLSKDGICGLLNLVHCLAQQLSEKKKKVERIESTLQAIESAVKKMENI